MEQNIEESEKFNEEEKKIKFLEDKFENHKDKVWIEAEIKALPWYEIKNWLLEKQKKLRKTKSQKWKAKLKKDYLLNVDTNLEETNKVEKKVKKDWNLIFDWVIEDIRYDDKFTKSQWYYLIRVRHLKWKEWNKEKNKMVEVDKYQLTIKKEWKSTAEAQEYEETFESKEEIEKALEWNWFKAKKRYKKTRQEYSVDFSKKDNEKSNLDLNWKHLKISFDKYQDYTKKEIDYFKEDTPEVELKNYWNLPKFLELESPDWKKYSLEWIKKYGLENMAQITWWPKMILEFKELEKSLVSSNIINNKDLVSAILANFISSNKELYKWLTDKEREKYKETFTYIKWLSKLFTVSIKKSLKDLVKKEPKYLEVFNNLIFKKPYLKNYVEKSEENLGYEKINFTFLDNSKKPTKFTNKFYEKINKYLNWFEISVLNSIQKDLQNRIEKGEIITDEILEGVLKNKLNSFIELLFIFWNNLNKEQLEEMLDEDLESINSKFESIKWKIEKIFNYEEISEIKTFSLTKMIRFLVSEEYFENKKIERNSNKGRENKEKIILKDKIEEHILDSFIMLSKDFSTWLNSPKNKTSSEDEYVKKLKETYKDLFKVIKILKEKKLAFSNFIISKNNIFESLLGKIKYSEKIFNDKNFSLWDVEGWIDKEKELLKKFILWLDNEEDDVIWEIRDEFLNFNENRIIDILYKKVEYWDKEISIKEFEKIVNWEAEEKFEIENISYSLWKTISHNLRFDIYIKHILKNEKKFNEIYWDIINFDKNSNNEKIDKKIDSFIKIEYRKKKNLKKDYEISIWDESYNLYKEKTLEQIKSAKKVFMETKGKLNLIKLFETNKNDSDLLVAWLRFNFKYDEVEEKWKDIEKYHISSENFVEEVILNLSDEFDLKESEDWTKKLINKTWTEIIIWTTESHNTSGWNSSFMKKRWRQVIEKWIINTKKSFYFEEKNWKRFFKDTEDLYLPGKNELSEWLNNEASVEDKNDHFYKKTREYIFQWLDLCRAIASKEFVDEDLPYYKILEKNNFPFKDSWMVSKLNKFLKYSLSVLEVSNDMVLDSYKDKKFLDENFGTKEFRKKLDLKDDEVVIWDVKWIDRTFAKNNWKYAGNVSKIWDLTRMMITKSSFEDLANTASDFIKYAWKIEWVKQIWIEDSIWNLFEKAPKKASW